MKLAFIAFVANVNILMEIIPGFFWTFRKKLKAKKTQAEKKTQANFQKTQANHSKTH